MNRLLKTGSSLAVIAVLTGCSTTGEAQGGPYMDDCPSAATLSEARSNTTETW